MNSIPNLPMVTGALHNPYIVGPCLLIILFFIRIHLAKEAQFKATKIHNDLVKAFPHYAKEILAARNAVPSYFTMVFLKPITWKYDDLTEGYHKKLDALIQ